MLYIVTMVAKITAHETGPENFLILYSLWDKMLIYILTCKDIKHAISVVFTEP